MIPKHKSIYLLPIIILFSSNLNGQNKDSKIVNQLNSLNVIVDTLELKINQLKLQNAEMKEMRIREEYFHDIIRSQTGIFTIITSGFFILFGLLSYAGFRLELNKLKEEYKSRINESEKRVNDFLEKNNNLEKGMLKNSGRVNLLISQRFRETKHGLADVFHFGLNSSKDFFNSGNIKAAKSNLESAIATFKEVSIDDSYSEYLAKNKEELFKTLSSLEISDNEHIVDSCAELRISMKNYFKKIEEKE